MERINATTRAKVRIRELQAAARAAVNSNAIPNGLAEGGLKVLTGPNAKWDGANAPVQSGNTVDIKQTAAQALLHWETFHVGSQTTVNFDQSSGGADAGKWIAFNKVFDPAARPSEIRGQINAQGQVYIINRNGIIFGSGSQINARALVASSLPINDNLVRSGLLNNKDAQFLFSGLNVPGGSDGTPAFNPDPLPAGSRFGDIVVERGARISSPEGEGGNGGRVLLAGPNIFNEGEIFTPSGQTILAAGLQVGVRAHLESDPSLRGLDAWVGSTGDYGGSIWNKGLIESKRGSIVAVGKNIHQEGFLETSTSVNLNGRIDLLASYGATAYPDYDKFSGSTFSPFLNQFTGIVTFATGSVTRILPEYDSTKKIPGDRLAQKSQVNVEGLGIHFEPDSALIATSGDIRIRAGVWPFKDSNNDGTTLSSTGGDEPGLNQQFVSGAQKFLLSGGQVNLAAGSLIDASGTQGAFVPLSQNIVTVQLRGSELAGSPLQQAGAVRGKPLVVDLRQTGTDGGRAWLGTPLGDLTGLANIIERDISQLTTGGGSVSLAAGDSVVAASGAVLDVSGGHFRHGGGVYQTTLLVKGDQIVPIHEAIPGVVYDGIFTPETPVLSNKWGARDSTSLMRGVFGEIEELPYIEGAAGGSLAITSPKMALDGKLLGQTFVGPRQLKTAPRHGSLEIRFQGEDRLDLGGNSFAFVNHSPAPPKVIFTRTPRPASSIPFTLVDEKPQAMEFAAGTDWLVPGRWWSASDGGFGRVLLENTEGDISIAQGADVSLPEGGSLILAGRNISVASNIRVPGGTIGLTAYNFTPLAYTRASALGFWQTNPRPV